jgi:hypothetical protein
MGQQLLPAAVAEFEQHGRGGRLPRRLDGGFPDEVNGEFEALVERGQGGVLLDGPAQLGRLLGRQFPEQQGRQAGLEFFA